MIKKLDLSFFNDTECFNTLKITKFEAGNDTDNPVTPTEPTVDPDKPVFNDDEIVSTLSDVKNVNINDIEAEFINTSVPGNEDTDKGTFYSITNKNIIID